MSKTGKSTTFMENYLEKRATLFQAQHASELTRKIMKCIITIAIERKVKGDPKGDPSSKGWFPYNLKES